MAILANNSLDLYPPGSMLVISHPKWYA